MLPWTCRGGHALVVETPQAACKMDQLAINFDALSCGVRRWNQIWGDPFLSGTIFMVSYGMAAVLIFRVAQQSPGKERWLWRLCGFLFLFQVLNTHLDLHAFPGAVGRCLAQAQGWYEHRGSVKLAFLIGLAVCAILISLVILIAFYCNIAGNLLLVCGVAIVLGFTLIKGIGYKEAEQLYGVQIGPFRIADFIEFSGIMIAMAAALKRTVPA